MSGVLLKHLQYGPYDKDVFVIVDETNFDCLRLSVDVGPEFNVGVIFKPETHAFKLRSGLRADLILYRTTDKKLNVEFRASQLTEASIKVVQAVAPELLGEVNTSCLSIIDPSCFLENCPPDKPVIDCSGGKPVCRPVT